MLLRDALRRPRVCLLWPEESLYCSQAHRCDELYLFEGSTPAAASYSAASLPFI